MQSLTSNQNNEQLSPVAAEAILEQLPERIKNAVVARAAEINYPVEAVIEMAVALQLRFALNAGYLDPHAVASLHVVFGFADCKPGRKA